MFISLSACWQHQTPRSVNMAVRRSAEKEAVPWEINNDSMSQGQYRKGEELRCADTGV